MKNDIKLSIIIKALNEQANIRRTIESALKVTSLIGGEVILADSMSTDATIEIAKEFPITIIQLTDSKDRSCGIGAQLGYQHAKGEFIYILDGDMEISAEFVEEAINWMTNKPNYAGIAGLVEEMCLESLGFVARVKRAASQMCAGTVTHLAMGGLYRRSAIEQIGYLTNRNLHSYEEFELGIRLRACGWELYRLPIKAIKHYGYTLPAYQLLNKRWTSRYALGIGELLKSTLGKPHKNLLLKELNELRLYCANFCWWLIIIVELAAISSLLDIFLIIIPTLSLPFLLMIIKKRNISLAVYSIISWQYFTAGLIFGFYKTQKNPEEKIHSKILLSSNTDNLD